MWEVVTKISTPISLVAFIAALIFTWLTRRIKSQEKIISQASPEKKDEIIIAALETYNLKNDNLTRAQKYNLVKTVLDNKSKRFTLTAILFFALSTITITLFFITNAFFKIESDFDDFRFRVDKQIAILDYANLDKSRASLFQLIEFVKKVNDKDLKMYAISELREFIKSQTETAKELSTDDIISVAIRSFRNDVLEAIIDLSERDLTNYIQPTDFENIDLAFSNFSNLNLGGYSFKGCNLIYTNFSGSDLRGANFNNCLLRHTDFKNSILDKASFRDADWYNALNLTKLQFFKVKRESIDSYAPRSIEKLISKINEIYVYNFNDYGKDSQESLVKNWTIYLEPDGIIETANSWK